jgi:hypothetical protein
LRIRKQYEARKAADKRRADEQAPKPWWWLGQIDPIARYTKWLSYYTFALFVATIVSAVILWITDHTLKETLEATNRAWITPNVLHLEKPIKAGEVASSIQYYGNIGHEPAINVGSHSEGKSLAADVCITGPVDGLAFRFRDAIHALEMPDSCALAEKERFAGVMYPGPSDGYNKTIEVEGKWITPQIEMGLGFLVVKGCIVYETMGKTRRSKYCFLYNQKANDSRSVHLKGYWMNCITDNEAN